MIYGEPQNSVVKTNIYFAGSLTQLVNDLEVTFFYQFEEFLAFLNRDALIVTSTYSFPFISPLPLEVLDSVTLSKITFVTAGIVFTIGVVGTNALARGGGTRRTFSLGGCG